MKRWAVVLGALFSLVVIAPIGLVAFVGVSLHSAQSICAAGSTDQGSQPVSAVQPGRPGTYGGSSLTGEQVGNARAIYDTGRAMGVQDYGEVIALTTAMGESTMRVLGFGDLAGPDSRGLFQQRAQGWGSLTQRMNPAGSARAFYTA